MHINRSDYLGSINFPIPWDRCKEGAESCFKNAERLLNDAVLLLQNNTLPSSSFLAFIALEEVGKGNELYDLYDSKLNLSKSRWKKLSRGGAHERKLKTGLKLSQEHMRERFSIPLIKSHRNKESFEEAYSIFAHHYQWRKEQNLYVGLDGNGWILPDAIWSEMTQIILTIMVITEGLEGCVTLSKRIGVNSSELESRYESFSDLFYNELMKLKE